MKLAHCDVNVTGAVNFVKAKFFGDDSAYDVVYDDEPLSDDEGGAGVAGGGEEKEGNDDEEDASSDGISVADGSLCDQKDENKAVADAEVEITPSYTPQDKNGTATVYKGKHGKKKIVMAAELYCYRNGS